MEKLAVLGGTFNPIHNAHLAMAQAAVTEFLCDHVLFMTGGNPPHKHQEMPDAHVRMAMVSLAIQENPRFFASDYEIKKETYCYTSETMEYLHNFYPDTRIYFIIGADSLADLEKWHDVKRLFEITEFLVFRRGGSHVDIRKYQAYYKDKFGARLYCMDTEIPSVSSTLVRSLLECGKEEEAADLIPHPVMDYIKMNHLYQRSEMDGSG